MRCENPPDMNSPAMWATGVTCAAAGVFSWAAVAPSSQLFGKTIRRTRESGTLALTFDDGPNPTVTPALLELLARHKMKATFFLIGTRVLGSPALAQEISAQGHTIGNHTHTHPALTFCSPTRIAHELKRCNDAIHAATGKTTPWMRPPFGYRGPWLASAVKNAGSREPVMWSRSARDWKPQPAQPVIERLRHVRVNDIVLLHDGDHRSPNGDRSHILAALEYWIPRWLDAGFRFVNLDEISEHN
jgi:peptidoglycan-N-acetylglucosamine deacetylase